MRGGIDAIRRPCKGNLDAPCGVVYTACMTERSSEPDKGTGRPNTPANNRDARLKTALKANIARRKAQARARSAGADDTTEQSPDTESGNEAG